MRPRVNAGSVFSRFFEDLGNGDPIAVGVLIVLLVIAAALGLFVWKVARDLKREDEAKKNRWKVKK